MKPILSVCIPTYNREKQLKETLNSIISEDIFINTDKIEVLISDNCSKDNTTNMVREFINKYPDKIKYSKNERNLGFGDNFNLVMNMANGEFLKLHNDYASFKKGSLEYMVNIVEEYLEEKPLLFFEMTAKNNEKTMCQNLDEFIAHVSYFNTWISSFGIWKEDYDSKDDWYRKNFSSIPQTDIILRQVSEGKKVMVINHQLFDCVSVSKKGGYNIAEVFGYNYLNILKEFVNNGTLSKKVYEKEKKKILLKHINYFYFDLKNEYAFKKTGYFKWLFDDYKYNPYFYIAYIKIRIKIILNYIFSVKKEKIDGYKIKTIKILFFSFKIKKKIKNHT